jgi:NADP-dependent 3-hydroxy acid dehydrogenase YdfG/acyl carrier protein
VHAETHRVLGAIQGWVADERFVSSRMVVLTQGAMALEGEAVTDLAGAAVWGLVRTAQSEYPGMFQLADIAADEDIAAVLPSSEPQLVVRAGKLHGARLARVPAQLAEPAERFGRDGTTLVTGASGSLARLVTEHLVTEHGVRNLLLVSRRGSAAEGMPELESKLNALGAQVTVAACDTADREALAGLLAEHPVRNVVHLAGTLDDGAIASLTPERMDTVLRPKVDAALNLHELTATMDLAAFVLFSSASGTIGNPGQGNYAAANAFLDALAAYRRAKGMVGQSLAWGLWSVGSSMSGELGETDLRRLRRMGFLAFDADQGMDLLKTSIALDVPVLVPLRLDLAAMAEAGEDLPPLFRSLVRKRPVRRAATAGSADSLRDKLASLSRPDQVAVLLDLVRTTAGLMLGYDGPDQVTPDRAFKDVGFDSVTSVEFRDQLNAATGLRLPATLVFDFPNAQALTSQLLAELAPDDGAEVADEDQIRRMLQRIPMRRLRDVGVLDALLKLAAAPDVRPGEDGITDVDAAGPSIDEMDPQSLISMALGESALEDDLVE